MSQIVAARFPTFERADEVAQGLYARQIGREDVSVFFVTPPGQHAQYPIGGDHFADPAAEPAGSGARWGILGGALIGLTIGLLGYWIRWPYWLLPVVAMLLGGYIGSFAGALGKMQERAQTKATPALRDAGVMLAVRVTETNAGQVKQLLQEGGAEDVEQAEGVWKDGEWQDFDPRRPPDTNSGSSAASRRT